MEDKLLKVKHVFDKVKDMRSDINLLFNNLDGRICKLAEIYDEFIVNTHTIRTPDIRSFIFSLDSFYFQNSLLRREYKYLKDYYNIIINRMYGEYYKLFKIMTEYVDRSLIDNKLSDVLKNKKYPRYDDLDDEKVYDFKLITQINEDIMGVITYLINILKDKESSLKLYTMNQNYGLNVNNFVSTFNYEVVVLQEQILLFEKYLDFFYHVHEKLLHRLITKVSVLEAQLNADIKFEGGLISKKKDNQVLFDEMGINRLNEKTANELRKSIIGSSYNFNYEEEDDSTENSNNIIAANPITSYIVDDIPPIVPSKRDSYNSEYSNDTLNDSLNSTPNNTEMSMANILFGSVSMLDVHGNTSQSEEDDRSDEEYAPAEEADAYIDEEEDASAEQEEEHVQAEEEHVQAEEEQVQAEEEHIQAEEEQVPAKEEDA